MKRRVGIFFIPILLFLCLISNLQIATAQINKYSDHGWQLEDFRTDSVFGAGINYAYKNLLKGKTANPVVVAVIDVGVDTAHEDLVGHIWTNSKEIPGNGIDDDHNGYVDDIHGWNFLGGKDDRNIIIESYESYREYFRLRNEPPVNNYSDSLYRLKVRKYMLNDSTQVAHSVFFLGQLIPEMLASDSIFKSKLNKDSIYYKDVTEFQPTDSASALLKKNTLIYFKRYGMTSEMSLGSFARDAESYLQISKQKLKYFTGDPNAQRKELVGDDYNNINDRNYGNSNVSAGTPSHGTHVSGIIAASRGNGKGIDGVTAQVYIMALRAVPEGDERDKDIALAIRYAVDNGARIVNMSFGKYLSPGKFMVDEAVRYAETHDVLLVDAAGNEFQNLDSVSHYPNPVYQLTGKNSCCWITVGANSGGPDSTVFARFSNYGKKEVDLFAPGVKVYSTLPGNQYASYSGTSMAAPMVTGVAALLLEYYPKLSARQLKYIIMHSVMKLPEKEVRWPGNNQWVDFSQLSVSGGIVNAYNALQLAATMKGEHKNEKKNRIQGTIKN
jgi:cell wall-associated protease